MLRPLLLAGLVGALLAVLSQPATAVVPTPAPFEAAFNGVTPSSPQPFSSPDWDITVHVREFLGEGAASAFHQVEPMEAAHGPGCSPPPDTHTIDRYEEAVYVCAEHLMTALNASAYGAVYLVPPRLLDLSADATVRWDMSTLRTSHRDWVDLWISPYEDHVQAPLEEWLPDLNGYPRNAIHVRMDWTDGGTIFRVFVIEDFELREVTTDEWTKYESFLEPDARRRDAFELRLSGGRLSFCMPDYGHCWADGVEVGALGWERAVVQFGHHSYTPYKDGGGGPNTWHWDNFRLDPAVPFTRIPADRRFVDATTDGVVRFAEGAPAGAHLRFMGIGALEVSVDGGRTWAPATERADLQKTAPELFRPYWVPVPPGTREVHVRGGPDEYQEEWHARDFSIWSASPPAGDIPPDRRAPLPPTILHSMVYTGPGGASPAALADDLGGEVASIARFDAATQSYFTFVPGAPAWTNTLEALEPGDALFLRLAGAAVPAERGALPDGAGEVPLSAGLNFVAYTGADGLPASELGALAPAIRSIARWDTGAQQWQTYVPGAPEFAQTLEAVAYLDALMITTSDAAVVEWPAGGAATAARSAATWCRLAA